ncbi:VCBS repeat-containing protein [Streptomyces sp. ISL-36]|nr:VCBS repeat-containing protein [Streptomyces sp. ISL-36]
MLLAAPASADEPGNRPVAEQPDRTVTELPKIDLSKVERSDSARAAATTSTSPVRFDVDGDGAGDLIYRAWDGLPYTTLSSGAEGGMFYGSDANDDLALDMIPIGDQDGNGQPEVLTLSPYGTLRLYADATATDGSYRWQGGGWTLYNKVFSPGDVDGDGRADLIGRQHNGDLYLYLANGSTTSAPFGPRAKVGSGWNIYDQIVGVGDNDGDGKGDVIGRTPDGKLYFYGSTGSASAPFKARQQVGSGWGIYNQIIAIDDVNGDGAAELFARDMAGTLWAYTGLGDGRLGPRTQLSEAADFLHVDQFGGAGSIAGFGKNSLMARDGAGTLFWYGAMNNGNLTARDQVGDVGGWAGANISLASSLDAGGFPTMLEVYDGRLYNWYGHDYGAGWGVYNVLVGPGDLTGDGKGDLLARTSGGDLYLYRGNGLADGFASRIKVGSGWGIYNRILGAGDFSGDGRTDIVTRDSAGDLYLYRGTGSAPAPFGARVKIGSGWNTYGKVVAPGDLNSDGKADLLGVNSAGELYRYLGTGTGTGTGAFGPRVRIGTGFQIYNGMY